MNITVDGVTRDMTAAEQAALEAAQAEIAADITSGAINNPPDTTPLEAQ